MGDIDKYPSPKEAIFGNGHVANLRCAIKYVAWQLTYTVIAAFGLLFAGLVYVGEKVPVGYPLKYIGRFGQRVAQLSIVRPIITYFWYGVGVLVVALFLYTFVYYTIFALIVTGYIVALGASAIFAKRYGDSIESWLRRNLWFLPVAAEKSKQTPGVRRVYGHCPVSFDIEPKWFERFDELVFNF